MDSLGDVVEELNDRPISLSLSGGGFRASLFSLGALLYLVDSGENERVRSMASVSGSSVLSGLVLQAGDFSKMSIEQIDAVAVQLLSVVLHKGLVWSSRVAAALLSIGALIASWWLCEFLFGWPVGLRRWQLAIVFAVMVSVALFRGVLISWRMSRAFFRVNGAPATLASVSSDVTHVFCATDLNSAEPVLIEAGARQAMKTSFGTGSTDDLLLEFAVRASTAFPGAFPPKRLRLDAVGLAWKDRTQRVRRISQQMSNSHRPPVGRIGAALARLRGKLPVPRSIYLADGGVHNNLATSPYRMDKANDLLLVVDSSAPLENEPLRHLAVPFFAELGAVARSMAILYSNTVEPRFGELELRGAAALRDPARGMFPVVVRMTDNTSDGLIRLGRTAETAGVLPPDEQSSRIFHDSWKELRRNWSSAARYMSEQHMHRVMAARSYAVPTTFNALDRSDALGLIVHGYLLTMLSMAFTDGSPSGELDMERFERIVNRETGSSPGIPPPNAREVL